MIQVEEQARDDVNQLDVITKIKSLGRSSISLAWLLADIKIDKTYQSWQYHSFNKWVDDAISNSTDPTKAIISKSYAYALADIGVVFRDYDTQIENLIDSNKVGISYLRDAAKLVKDGSDFEVILAIVLAGQTLPKSDKSVEDGTEQGSTAVESFVPKGDAENFQQSLVMFAMREGFKNTNDSLTGMVLSEYPELLNWIEDSPMKKYLPLIKENKYFCQHCGSIPVNPTFHHVYPQSLGKGFGPQILLCWECHSVHIQPNWQKYLAKWLGDGAEERIKKEINEIITEDLEVDQLREDGLPVAMIFPLLGV